MTKNKAYPFRAYTVSRLVGELKVDADWNKPQWQAVPAMVLDQFCGERPEHFPHTQAKLMYDDENIHLIFKVDDRYVRSLREDHQSMVCRDSCVEFFFTPGEDIKEGYFNVEINCGGTLLFRHQTLRNVDEVLLSDANLDRVEIAHSLPSAIMQEIEEPTLWTLEYRLPLEILNRYAPVVQPKSGTVWRANLYKCADETSHPHWLSWSPINRPAPDFHRPDFFGELVFE